MQHIAAVAIAATQVAVAAGCSPASVKPAAKVSDGELAVPADYRSWPKFLVDVQRPDAKQIRDIYINPIGSGIGPGETFPNGTVSVMDLYKARENPDGSLMKTPDGKLVKGDLLKVFVMGKGAGWGDTVAKPELKNGDWVYGAYKADARTPSGDDIAACRGCHLPVANKDFVHRYDEYFQTRVATGAAKFKGGGEP